jgi:predicted esterase
MSAGVSAVRVSATANHTASVIWLHGLGDTGQGWKFLSRYYDFPVCSQEIRSLTLACEGTHMQVGVTNSKWIFPNAPTIPITLNGGYRMPGWFDVYNLGDINGRQDEDRMMESVKTIHKLIKEEVDAGVPSERIIVGGFSQGRIPKTVNDKDAR